MKHWHSVEYLNVGRVRTLNEDALLTNDEQNLWVVADGMGGHEHGDVASKLVTDTLAEYRQDGLPGLSMARIVASLSRCNHALRNIAEQNSADVVGCTVAVLSLHGAQAACSWSGDSRVYRLRHGKLRQLTRDHCQLSTVEDRNHLMPDRVSHLMSGSGQLLTHAIGGGPDLQLEHAWFTVLPEDRYILCTDGLYKEVGDEEIRDALLSSPDNGHCVEQLATLYHERGARDNVGLVCISHTT